MCADNDGFVVIKSGKSYNNIVNTVCVHMSILLHCICVGWYMDIHSGNKDSGKRFEMIALCGNVWKSKIHSQPFHNNRNNKLRLLSVAATI